MKAWTIKWRVTLLAIVPMAVLAALLAGYFTKSRMDEMERALGNRGRSLARQLAPLAEYGVFTGNRLLLGEFADSIRREPDLRTVVIADANGAILALAGNRDDYVRGLKAIAASPQATFADFPGRVQVSEPIRRSVMRLDDPTAADNERDTPQEIIGVVSLTLGKEGTAKAQRGTLLRGGAITLAGLLLTALLALRMSLGITRPIKRLVSAVEQISNGELGVQVNDIESGEVQALARGINSMSDSLKTARENLQEKIRSATEQLTYQATHDTLTGLINRREFEARLEQAFTTAHQFGNVHALFFMDLDQFKVVNDTCGHAAGDELLRQIGHQLRQKIRDRDILARIGGDEFTVLLENCHLDHAVEVAQELRQAVQNFRFDWEDRVFAIGASIGIVMITHASESAAMSLSQADSACYTAKDLGRNRIYVFSDDDAKRHERVGAVEWVTRITHAFQERRFVLYCQSILPLRRASEGDPYLFEILLRMRGKDGEIIMPTQFIAPAEQFNQMQAVDRWVIEESFSVLQRLLKSTRADSVKPIFSINLSGSSLCDERFAGFLRQKLEEMDIPPASACFEITETAAIRNFPHAIKLIEHFKHLGCRFVLDDFGAGLSSFNYLKHLPVNGIKIDGAFVRGMDGNRMDYTMVQAINNIGHALGLYTTAEFVEDDATMRKLLALEVDYAQGNWVQRPQPLEEWFANELESRNNIDNKRKLVIAASAG
jgi:diguanylate cyclase (GGDEF)-like protein